MAVTVSRPTGPDRNYPDGERISVDPLGNLMIHKVRTERGESSIIAIFAAGTWTFVETELIES